MALSPSLLLSLSLALSLSLSLPLSHSKALLQMLNHGFEAATTRSLAFFKPQVRLEVGKDLVLEPPEMDQRPVFRAVAWLFGPPPHKFLAMYVGYLVGLTSKWII